MAFGKGKCEICGKENTEILSGFAPICNRHPDIIRQYQEELKNIQYELAGSTKTYKPLYIVERGFGIRNLRICKRCNRSTYYEQYFCSKCGGPFTYPEEIAFDRVIQRNP